MFIGRKKELDRLDRVYEKRESSLIAIYGRRRIGKTELIRHFAKRKKTLFLEITGKYNSTMDSQLLSFSFMLNRVFEIGEKKISSWAEAFEILQNSLEEVQTSYGEKIILFFDELPWLDSHKSNFLSELGYFWNRYCENREDIVLIVCGSTASYIIDKVIHNRGPLHKRVTDTIALFPFSLGEVREYLKSRGFRVSNKSVVDLYMVFGGVAKYLSYLDNLKTIDQNIQALCFEYGGIMIDEYDDLFRSLFNNHATHREIIDLLSSKWSGFTQKEIMQKLKKSGLSISKPLFELETSGFIISKTKYGQRTRDTIYRISDPFCFFYSKWMKKVSIKVLLSNQNYWLSKRNKPAFSSWSGFAFENICHLHIIKIKEALGVLGINSSEHYWSQEGAQIDILIDYEDFKRFDIIECKYYKSEFTITSAYKKELLNKLNVLDNYTKNRFDMRLFFITSYGVVKNEHYNEICNGDFDLEILFSGT